MDLHQAQRPCAGHRPRRAEAQAVPLPRRLGAGARRRQVRADHRLRPGLAALAPAPAPRPGVARLPARQGAGDGGGADGRDPGPRRQCRIRAQQPLLWPHHAAQPAPGIRQGRPRAAEVPRQGRAGARHRGRRRASGQADSRLPAIARAGAVPVPRRRRPAAASGFGRGQRLSARGDGRALHRQGLPHLGRDPRRAAAAGAAAPARTRQRARAETGAERGDPRGGRCAGQYPGGVPQGLHRPMRV